MSTHTLDIPEHSDAGSEDYNLPTEENQAAYDPSQKRDLDTLASAGEMETFNSAHTGDWFVFTEDRAHSVPRFTAIPQRWLAGDFTGGFKGSAQPGEFYVFQIVPYAAKVALGDLRVTFTDLKGADGIIPAERLRCLSLAGNDFHGRPFAKDVSVPQGRLQPLWIGIDIARETRAGTYSGMATVSSSAGSMNVPVEIAVDGSALDDHGDGDSWRLSRLRWLDSAIGLDDNSVTAPYLPITVTGGKLSILGRELELGAGALPGQVRSYFNAANTRILKQPTHELFARPLQLVIETDNGSVALETSPVQWDKAAAVVRWTATAKGEGITVAITGEMEYDGYVNYRCALSAEQLVEVKDIRLEFAVAKDCAGYFMGLGLAGGKRLAHPIAWAWNPEFNQDGFWIGAINAGFKIQFYGDNWRTPLINAYYHWRELVVPESWGGSDGSSGKICVSDAPDGSVPVVVSSGARTLEPGTTLGYNFRLFLTPFRPLNTEEQWSLRYLHSGGDRDRPIFYECDKVRAMGANVLNIHHNQDPNPTINYPYFDQSLPLLKKAVASGHANGVKVKIYYTLREITSNLPELFAFFSMGGELICPSPGKDGANARPVTNKEGPHPWLLDHLGPEGYIPAWRETIGGRYGGLLDLAVLTTPDSRLCNFYLEGLAFTLRETGIDGLYIDDTSLDRKTFQRAHRIFEKAGKPLLVDMHSWNHLKDLAGNTSSAYLFMQNYPYYHRLWHGESFNCNAPLDNMLVEQSGIPFGLMSEMLDNPNVWHGMVLGEVARLGWKTTDPRPLWKLWDDFGIAGSDMIGFWDPCCPVQSGNESVPVTIYCKPGKTLVAIASWSGMQETVKLAIDWRALGLDPAKAGFRAPAITDFQPQAAFAADADIPIEPGKGWLLILENRN